MLFSSNAVGFLGYQKFPNKKRITLLLKKRCFYLKCYNWFWNNKVEKKIEFGNWKFGHRTNKNQSDFLKYKTVAVVALLVNHNSDCGGGGGSNSKSKLVVVKAPKKNKKQRTKKNKKQQHLNNFGKKLKNELERRKKPH